MEILVIIFLIVIVLACLVIFFRNRSIRPGNAVPKPLSPTPTASPPAIQNFGLKKADSFDYFAPVIEALSRSLNLTTENLENSFQAGNSIADLAQSKGIDLPGLRSSVLNSLNNQLSQATQAGKIKQQSAAKLYQSVEIWLDELVQLHMSDVDRWSKISDTEMFDSFIAQLAAILDKNPDQLKTQLDSGKSLNQLAAALRLSKDEFKQAVLATLEKQSEIYVNNLTITRSQATKLYQTLDLWWDEIANESDLLI